MAETTTTTTAPAKFVNPYVWGTGRRKSAIARVRIKAGSGQILINDRKMVEYFLTEFDREQVLSPLNASKTNERFDVFAQVEGGGMTGQAGAVCLGLARAIMKAAPEAEAALRDSGLLTRDSRMKERKKYGQKGARKRFQFSKR